MVGARRLRQRRGELLWGMTNWLLERSAKLGAMAPTAASDRWSASANMARACRGTYVAGIG